jgi:hypothetical protein
LPRLQNYYDGLSKFKHDASLFGSPSPEDIERVFVQNMGVENYDDTFAMPIHYRVNVSVIIDGREGRAFADCGESSLKSVLFMTLINKLKVIDKEKLATLKKKLDLPEGLDLLSSPFGAIEKHFDQFPSLESANSLDAHNSWACLI